MKPLAEMMTLAPICRHCLQRVEFRQMNKKPARMP